MISKPFPVIQNVSKRACTAPRISIFSPCCHYPSIASRSFASSNHTSTMATAYKVKLLPEDGATIKHFNLGPRKDTAEKVSELLQKDLDEHCIYFNDSGFHDHIVHHLLSIYVLGASPEDVQRAYDTNASYQRPSKPVDQGFVKKIHDREEFRSHLGDRSKYSQYLAYFQTEIDARGVESVLQEYIFAQDNLADDMLCRLFAGFVHPFIHLGFGLEFNQPAIIAQALAETATHQEKGLADFLHKAEYAAAHYQLQVSQTLSDLQEAVRKDEKVANAVTYEDADKLGALIKRAGDRMVHYTSQFRASHLTIDQKMAEIMNASVYFTGTAQRPDRPVKFDFYYIHCVNSNIFLPTIISLPWLSLENKIRLFEWKARVDLALYASRRPSPPRPLIVKDYVVTKSWKEAADATIQHPREDGHAAKLVRTLGVAEKLCKPFEGSKGFLVQGDLWLKLANMCADSIYPVTPMNGRWIYGVGFDEAWAVLDTHPEEKEGLLY